MDLTPGVVVAGRYRVERKVGAGGMGEVWLGEHIAVGVRVALKTLLGEPGRGHDVVARFKREAYLLGKVKSDHVARILDFVTDENFGTVLVMEFVDGDSLARVLQYKRLSLEETIDLGADVAAALVDLHRAKIIHRDLKPGNVILQPLAGDRKRAVIVDFGVSRMVSGGDVEGEEITGITKAGMTLGTLEYMSPEQILASRDAKETADIYALGAILWRAVSGTHVFADYRDVDLAQQKIRADPPELRLPSSDRISVGLCACITRAIKRRPAERYQRAGDMLADLAKLRDLARLAAIELDSATTLDSRDSAAAIAFASPFSSRRGAALAVPEIPDKGPSSPSAGAMVASVSAAPTSLLAASSSLAPEPAPRPGISRAVFATALAAALVGGVAGGALWGQRHSGEGRESPAAGASAMPAIAAPVTTIVVAPPSESAAPPSESAAPPIVVPAGTASASPIDFDGLDPASRAALDGTMPTMDGAATKIDAAVRSALPPVRPAPSALAILHSAGLDVGASAPPLPTARPMVETPAVVGDGGARLTPSVVVDAGMVAPPVKTPAP